MEHHTKVEYCSEDASPASRVAVHHHVVKETFEEVDKAPRPGAHGHHHHYGHHGRHHGHHHGHVEVREITIEEDVNTRTGAVYRKETTVIRTDDDDG
ncbi:hypothetical protein BAE44_0009913 [Dichanthelium oligosanthes]|uniref:Uncharacterized protein n=1 Tax=Dichanthelium oligosanthes TaxID=888268 RepID=A0A1E5VVC3_9POAL|nr:hypothetical protein BAE44_0009913 [Dichanthelium oligosanthes]